MPLIGFQCPDNSPTAGAKNEFSHCLNVCPHKCQPDFVLDQIIRRETANEHKGAMISPTALNGCARSLVLSRTVDYFDDPQSLFAATRGGMIHGFLEGVRLPGIVQEKRVYKIITTGPQAPWIISGRLDYYDSINRRIRDMKTMSDKGLYIVYKQGFKPEHAWQLNIYRWLLDGGRVDNDKFELAAWVRAHEEAGTTFDSWDGAPGEDISWPVDDLVIHYFLMNRVISTGQRYVDRVVKYNPKDVNYGKPYGCEVMRVDRGMGPKGYPVIDITLDIPSVPIYDTPAVEAYLTKRGPTLVKAFRDPSFIPPGVIGDKNAEWQCNFCSVKERCTEIEAATAVTAAPAPTKRRITLTPVTDTANGPDSQSAEAPELQSLQVS